MGIKATLERFSKLAEYLRIAKKNNVGVRYKESFPVHTHLEFVLRDAEGNHLKTVDLGENIITDAGRANMAHLLAGNDVSNRAVIKIKFGDGGHVPNNPTVPLTPSAADLTLYGTIIIEKIASYDFPDGEASTKVRFSATVSVDEGNGTDDSGSQAYSEVGLFDAVGRLLTHKTFGLITKSNAFSLTINYTILF